MKLHKHIDDTIAYRKQLKEENSSLGFVPTMGALHKGHVSLVEKAKKENERVAVSIFVNPIQFNNTEDLDNYPRTFENDLRMLSDILEPEDFIFAPTSADMYPNDIHKKYDFGILETYMEGAHRPGHFNGVGVVIDRLFQIIEPSRAYFGEKDFQQLAIIKKLTQLESYPVEIIACPIMRESDGLAMSSRNARLGNEDRKNASKIFYHLNEAKRQILEGTELEIIRSEMQSELNKIPNFNVEYISFAEEITLAPFNSSTNQPFRCFIAVFAGEIRLIDNLSMY